MKNDIMKVLFDAVSREINKLINDLTLKIIINGPATIVISGGKKTIVKCHEEMFDIEKGIAMALLKHAGVTRSQFLKLVKNATVQEDK